MYYAILANIETAPDSEWHGSHVLPVFFLNERTQGIVSCEHAVKIARTILDPFNEYGSRLKVFAYGCSNLNHGAFLAAGVLCTCAEQEAP